MSDPDRARDRTKSKRSRASNPSNCHPSRSHPKLRSRSPPSLSFYSMLPSTTTTTSYFSYLPYRSRATPLRFLPLHQLNLCKSSPNIMSPSPVSKPAASHMRPNPLFFSPIPSFILCVPACVLCCVKILYFLQEVEHMSNEVVFRVSSALLFLLLLFVIQSLALCLRCVRSSSILEWIFLICGCENES